MQKVFFASLVFSASAWACPSLSGIYRCTQTDRSVEVLRLSQDVKDSSVRYQLDFGGDFGTETFLADNLEHVNKAGPREFSSRCSCRDPLIAKVYEERYRNGGGTMSVSLSGIRGFGLNPKNELIYTDIAKTPNDPAEEIESKTCTKIGDL